MLNEKEIIIQRCSAIILRKEKLLLMFRRLMGKEFYVFPGGRMDTGETQEAALAREIAEETSLTIKKSRLILEMYDHINQHAEHVYLCVCDDKEPKIIGEELQKHSIDNFYRLDWVSLSDLLLLKVYPSYAKEWVIEMNSKDLFQTLLSEID